MPHIYNMSITARAADYLAKERARNRWRSGDVLEFGFIPSFTNPDGSMVKGFQPGYMASQSTRQNGPSPADLIAHLPDGTVFHFMPKFRWDAAAWYVVDVVGDPYQLLEIRPL